MWRSTHAFEIFLTYLKIYNLKKNFNQLDQSKIKTNIYIWSNICSCCDIREINNIYFLNHWFNLILKRGEKVAQFTGHLNYFFVSVKWKKNLLFNIVSYDCTQHVIFDWNKRFLTAWFFFYCAVIKIIFLWWYIY